MCSIFSLNTFIAADAAATATATAAATTAAVDALKKEFHDFVPARRKSKVIIGENRWSSFSLRVSCGRFVEIRHKQVERVLLSKLHFGTAAADADAVVIRSFVCLSFMRKMFAKS